MDNDELKLPEPLDSAVKPNKSLAYKMHQMLSGRPVSRRDLLIASAAGATAFAIERIFGSNLKAYAQGVKFGSGEPIIVNAEKFRQFAHDLGKYLYLTPQKLGGGTHVVDLDSGKTLAWISYWNYGDSCPISHHLAAYPSTDPYKGFDFVNSTQGGDNVMIYGLPTPIKERGLLDTWGQGNHIYRVNSRNKCRGFSRVICLRLCKINGAVFCNINVTCTINGAIYKSMVRVRQQRLHRDLRGRQIGSLFSGSAIRPVGCTKYRANYCTTANFVPAPPRERSTRASRGIVMTRSTAWPGFRFPSLKAYS
ncbi:MAG: hypothetical protein IPO31_02545 [Candidatus Obscuribacter sp.]|nr:hypothetical protein [Candidatus Obscuribacter sp.]